MLRFFWYSSSFILFFFGSQKLHGQQEIVPLPLDKLNRDSLDNVIAEKEKKGDKTSLVALYGGIYNYYLYSNSKDSGIKYALKAEENAYQTGDSAKYYFIQLQIGEFYTGLDFEKAKDYYERALKYYSKTKNYSFQATSLGALSYLHELKKDTASQLNYLNLAEKIIIISKDTFNMVGANDKRIGVLMNRNHVDSAIVLLNKNLVLLNHAKTFGNSENIRAFWKGWQLNKLADCYYRKGNYTLAIKYLNQALPYDNLTAGFDAQNIFRYRFLINSFIKMGQQDSAIHYVDAYYKQTIKTLENLNPQKLSEIASKYEAEKKQRQISELEQKNRLHLLAVNNQRKLNFAFVLIFLLMLVSSYFFIKNEKQKKRIALELSKKEIMEKEHLHQQKELEIRNRISRDLHDDVGATLSSVKVYSEILKDNPNNSVIAELIKENATEMIDRLELIAWAADSRFDHFGSLLSKMEKFSKPLFETKQINYSFSAEGIESSIATPGEVRQNILLIFKEAINNIIKHSSAKNCMVNLYTEPEQFILKIHDDGIGISEATGDSGNGIMNIKKRAAELGGKLEMKSTADCGTLISIYIPYPFHSKFMG